MGSLSKIVGKIVGKIADKDKKGAVPIVTEAMNKE